jgi:hypothetical protein
LWGWPRDLNILNWYGLPSAGHKGIGFWLPLDED